MRKRDYKAEYQRRIELGRERGLSRSQARGHARKARGELSTREIVELAKPLDDRRKASDTQKRLRAMALRMRREGNTPTLPIPMEVIHRLSHEVRQFIYGY